MFGVLVLLALIYLLFLWSRYPRLKLDTHSVLLSHETTTVKVAYDFIDPLSGLRTLLGTEPQIIALTVLPDDAGSSVTAQVKRNAQSIQLDLLQPICSLIRGTLSVEHTARAGSQSVDVVIQPSLDVTPLTAMLTPRQLLLWRFVQPEQSLARVQVQLTGNSSCQSLPADVLDSFSVQSDEPFSATVRRESDSLYLDVGLATTQPGVYISTVSLHSSNRLMGSLTVEGVVAPTDHVLFSYDDSYPTLIGKGALEKHRVFIDAVADYAKLHIYARGHADHRGKQKYNERLSQRRTQETLLTLDAERIKEELGHSVNDLYFGECLPLVGPLRMCKSGAYSSCEDDRVGPDRRVQIQYFTDDVNETQSADLSKLCQNLVVVSE